MTGCLSVPGRSLENMAILLWETAGCKVDYIRGVYASASLKLIRPSSELAIGKAYPRRLRLGLIEALRAIVGTVRIKPYIRGVYASASLKRR